MDVLSIDFDIIMAPSINMYNPMVPHLAWEEIFKSLPNLATTPADFAIYSKILRYLLDKIGPTTSIYVAVGHDKIKEYLQYDEELNITNIDHHHDIYYNHRDGEIKLNDCTCADWVKYFADQKQLINYTWIHNDNSIPFEQKIDFNFEDIEFKEFELNKKYDKYFLCLSPEWVPPYYHSLFYTILDCLNEKNNYQLEMH